MRAAGAAAADPLRFGVGVVSGTKARGYLVVPTDASQAIEYAVVNANNSVDMHVHGYQDDLA